MSDESDTPSLADILLQAIENHMLDVHTAIPAVVVSYDATKQRVSVQPLIKQARRDQTDERVVDELPVITDVPVEFPGSGAFSITWPIKKGDTGMLQFCEGSIDKWKTRGGVVDPNDDRRFNLSDAVFHPGVRSFKSPIPSAGVHASAMVVRAPNEIHVGGAEPLVTRAEFRQFIDNFYAIHTHPAPGGTTSAPSIGLAAGSAFAGTSKLKGG